LNELNRDSNGGDAAPWLILAMAHSRLGHDVDAHRWYTRATDQMAQQKAPEETVRDLQAEAAEVLGEHLSTDMLLRVARRAAAEERWDSSAADYAKAIEASEDNRNWDSSRKRICREVAQSNEVFQRIVAIKPKEDSLWIGRGDYRIEENSCEYAALQLLLNDPYGYQQFCQKLVAHAGEPTSGESAFIMARTVALGPTSTVAPQRIVAWAERAVKEDSRPWQLHVLGLALFRAGQFDAALSRLEQSNAGKWGTAAKAQNWLVQALIESRRRHGPEAQRLVSRAQQALHDIEPKQPNQPVLGLAPTDWVELAVLLREAEGM
jgi:tetratricopeptide (TPR) repeat protein